MTIRLLTDYLLKGYFPMAPDIHHKKQMTISSRQHLLKNIQQARDLVRLTAQGVENAEKADSEAANLAYENTIIQVTQLIREYEERIPSEQLSRCPFTGEELILAIDNFGLDGPWWEAENSARPVDRNTPSLFAYSGAIRLDDAVPHTPFLCKPGPEIPFVTPRILAEPAIKAVLSSVSIGDYPGYLVAYFSDNIPFDIQRVNSWGLNYYAAEDALGRGYRDKTFDMAKEYDFELEPWIRAGKLLWIAPGDDNLMLRSTVARCPYLQLYGRQYPVGILEGEIWNSLIDELE